jgi:excisionase family DNA binding protein
MTAEPLLLSPGQAAERIGCSRTSVFALVRSGRLRAVRPLSEAGELRFRDADLVAFVESLEAVDPAAVLAKVADERPTRPLAPVRRRRRPVA